MSYRNGGGRGGSRSRSRGGYRGRGSDSRGSDSRDSGGRSGGGRDFGGNDSGDREYGNRDSGGRDFGGRDSGGGRGGSRARGGRRHSRRGPPRRRDPREASQSGNARERISIESGDMVLIDQFMLANPQLLSALTVNLDADGAVKDKLIEDFGGCVVNIEPGTYRIERDPFAYTIVIHGEQERPDLEGITEAATESLGRVFIDTRCLAMIDRELLDDSDVLSKYQQLWFAGEEKACRDLIRDNGGAVRYGFQRYGDELGIYRIPDTNTICLWPDVAEEAAGADAGSEMAAAAE